MQEPPSAYGASPTLDEVSDTSPCKPFESLLEQRVCREILGRGYHVVPQYAIGSRRLDLVVVGDGARVAVECDGHRYHTSPDQVASDARRDRELRRMRWEVIRIRESEFGFDRAREPRSPALARRLELAREPRQRLDGSDDTFVTTNAKTALTAAASPGDAAVISAAKTASLAVARALLPEPVTARPSRRIVVSRAAPWRCSTWRGRTAGRRSTRFKAYRGPVHQPGPRR